MGPYAVRPSGFLPRISFFFNHFSIGLGPINLFLSWVNYKKSKLQVLSFMFTSNCRRCPLAQKLTGFVLNVLKSCTLCPLDQTQLDFLVKYGHVQGTWGYSCHFIFTGTIE
ncbi:hypothetical protein Hanom_Chr11g00984371 [Helianthus anomalus]